MSLGEYKSSKLGGWYYATLALGYVLLGYVVSLYF